MFIKNQDTWMEETIFEETARQYEQVAAELEQAARHMKTTARHLREREVPRGCAHAFAGYGHLCKAQELVQELAIRHSAHSQPLPEPSDT